MTNPLLEKLKEAAARVSTIGRYETVLEKELAGEDEVDWMVQVLALPHWFDYSLMSRLFPNLLEYETGMDFVGQPHDYAGDVWALSFVIQLPQAADIADAGQYAIDDPYREILRERWQGEDRREALEEWSNKLRNYFALEAKNPSRFDRAFLLREALFHQFITNEQEAWTSFQSQFEEAAADYQVGVCQKLVGLINEQEPFMEAPTSRAWLHYYMGRLHLLQGYWNKAEKAFNDTLEQKYIRANLRGRAQAGLGDASRATGEWSQAMQAYERSLREWYGKQPGTGSPDLEALVGLFAEAEEVKELEPADLLEVARVLSRMADLSERMGRPPPRINDILLDLTLRAKIKRVEKEVEGKSGILQRVSSSWRKSNIRSESEQEQRGIKERNVLSGVVRYRLQKLAGKLYDIAIMMTGDWSQESLVDSEALLERDLVLDIRFGQSRVKLDQKEAERGSSTRVSTYWDSAREELASLEELELSAHDRAELLLAQGDWSLSDRQLKTATEKYKEAVNLVQNTWDQPLEARALHRLGRVQVLEALRHQVKTEASKLEAINGGEKTQEEISDKKNQTRWVEAIGYLKRSGELFFSLQSPREEQAVQETVREIFDLEETPTEVKDKISIVMNRWPAHYFTYPSSTDVVNRVANIWWRVFGIGAVILTLVYFLLAKVIINWLLGLDRVNLAHIMDIWWVNVLLFLFCAVMGLFSMDSPYPFRSILTKLVGAGINWEQIWGSQADFIVADDKRYMQVDGKGQVRAFDWDEISTVRSGHSKSWIIADASLTASGQPGGRTILFSKDKAGQKVSLRFDATINSYFALDKLVKERVPKTTIIEHEDFSGTFRGMPQWILLTVFLLVFCGCPINFILTSENDAWWMIPLNAIAVIVAVLYGIALAYIIGSQLWDAFRMRGFLYGRNLPPEPDSDKDLSAGSISYDEGVIL